MRQQVDRPQRRLGLGEGGLYLGRIRDVGLKLQHAPPNFSIAFATSEAASERER